MLNIRISAPVTAFSLLLAACSGDTGSEEASSGETAAMAADSVEEPGDTQNDSDLPEWLPDGFALPDDFELDSANNIGGKYIIDGRTDMPLGEAHGFFSDELGQAGYDVEDDSAQNMVTFDGKGCESCTVTISDAGAWRTLRISLHLPEQ